MGQHRFKSLAIAIVEFLTKKNEDLRNEIRGYEQSSSKDDVCP
jgi:hypothetical protein